MESFDLFLGGFALLSGLYCFYAVYVMKKTGIINTTVLLDRETAKRECSNPGEFITKASPKLIVLGSSIVLYGVILLLSTVISGLLNITLVFILVEFAVLIWYAIGVNKLKKQYYN